MRKLRHLLIGYVVVALASGIGLYVAHPQGPLKWVLWTFFAPLAYTVISGAAELLVAGFFAVPGIRHVTQWVEARSKGRQVSGLRLLWYGTWLVILCISAIAVASLFAP